MTDDKPRIEFNWVQASAASLAAVTSAVLLSTFGVAGTLIGAAVGSLALTVGNAVYSYSINATKHRVATAQSVAVARVGQARAAASRTAKIENAPEKVREGPDQARRGREGDLYPVPEDTRGVLAALPWKRIAFVSLGVFVAAMLMILAFELVTGRAVSSFTGSDDRRNSIPGWGDGSATEKDPDPQDEVDPGEQEPEVPDELEATPGPGDEPTTDPTLPESPTVTTDSTPGSTSPSPDSVEPSPDSSPPSPVEPTPSG